MRLAMRSGQISETYIREALLDSRGDIFRAACTLACTAQELDRYIRASAELQNFAAAIETVKVDPAYAHMSTEQFENALTDLTRAYRVVGLEELHELATMDHGGSAAMAKVKLQAAISLHGGQQQTGGDREVESALSELNQLYHQNAPRIREIRQTVITLRDDRVATPAETESGLDLL